MSPKTIGRRVVDIGQKARGRMALRYELEVIPYLCGDVPSDVTHCSFAWERGSKLFVTEAEPVNPNTHAVFWKQYLRQTATIYKDHTELLPKDYAFKVQSVKPGSKAGEEKRKTVGKAHVNLAQFCSEALDAQPQEVLLHLKPCGKLKVSIKATWLRNAAVDSDALTEVTAPSMYADSQYDEEEEAQGEEAQQEKEQDLSGFDPETGEPLPNHRRSRGDIGASTSGDPDEQHESGHSAHTRKSKKHRRRRKMRTYNEDGIPEDGESGYGGQGGEEGAHEYGDPGGGGEDEGEYAGAGGDGAEGGGGGRRGRAGSKASKGEGRPRLQVYGARPNGVDSGPGGGGGGAGLHIEAGRQIVKAGWRDYLCCCLPRTGPAEDPLEGDNLLAKGALQGGGAGGHQAGQARRRQR
ncbi:hypothetical protein PLESTB_001233800 [Pleodorina starrii]|uniref:C2 NT-type domain-containing protein n=1 Tax=Pleodorina starrii TaxID=330485 RepID=A0A9W6BSC8_9CHLO|nr:hypothetical protein PLESTM_000225900 [Pleodorina starrii]GLC57499.1 hypothetical protein PLESTB_001233800 [Pleodorina starrii]GLC63172.1 hypothetical protein PLESTF_000007900 [Pleodorina starrii]